MESTLEILARKAIRALGGPDESIVLVNAKLAIAGVTATVLEAMGTVPSDETPFYVYFTRWIVAIAVVVSGVTAYYFNDDKPAHERWTLAALFLAGQYALCWLSFLVTGIAIVLL